ncbi:MAG: hypothetical protein K2P84_02665 [Undibacterium sp.]|nr:hypothetical protein [Undibacterium sp.]
MSLSTIPFKKIALYILSLFVGFALLLIIINLPMFDEELRPDVKLANQIPSEIDPQQNAYFSLLGMQASAEKDMHLVGVQLTARHVQNREQHQQDELTAADREEIAGGEDLDRAWLEQYSSCNSRKVSGCLAKMVAEIEKKPVTDVRFQVAMRRYKQLIEMGQYQDLQRASPGTPLPQFGTPLRFAKIYLAQLSIEKDPLVFLIALKKDMKFWRMVLNQSTTLISKMIATAVISNDLQYLSEFLQNKTFTTQQQRLIQELLVVLSKDELDISKAIWGEGRMMMSIYNSMKENQLVRMTSQYNATLNIYYDFAVKPDIDLAKLSSMKLAQALSQTRPSRQLPLTWSPSSLYNIMGKLLVVDASPSFIEYIARVHDLNGMILLVQLQLSLKSLPIEALEDGIKKSPIKNPYTNQAMLWNKANGTIEFKCLEAKSICQVKI